MTLRILLVDDHPMFRQALRMSLEMLPDVQVVAEAASAASALTRIAEVVVDVVCLDINLPDQSGIALTAQLISLRPGLRIIALSAYSDVAVVGQMLQAGASAYVLKSNAGDELPLAIAMLDRGQVYLSPDLGITQVSALAGVGLDAGKQFAAV
jgi:two-component system NarL family response regulator